MLPIERGSSLVFRAHNLLDRRKIQLAKRIVLIAKQALSPSTMLDGVRPDVHHLPPNKRFYAIISILSKKP